MTKNSINFSIIIPCYNEIENINFLLKSFSFLNEHKDVELIVVDNGSNDGTSNKLTEIMPDYGFARSVKVDKNQGYGYGILRGLKEAKGEYLGWTHGDLQFDAKDILKAIGIINSTQDKERIFVKGARNNRPLVDTFFTMGMSVFETLYMGAVLWDINGQPVMFHRSLMAYWKAPPYDFSLDLYAYLIARKQHFLIKRFDVFLKERKYGFSSWNNNFFDRFKLIGNILVSSRKIKKSL
ncbi:MAG: glycosyltransferase family 2 protein [Elusimicrobia bacterium]|nr:glycosyltransferase family 2 protein [Elusimicrobiota bacterium]